MTDFLLELRCEEIPARMQLKASDDLARLFAEKLAESGLTPGAIESFVTPRRLALIARDLPLETQPVSEERKGPRANAPEQALAGFLRSTGLTREQLVERDGILFAIIEKPGRATADVLAEAIPAIVRAFPWPKSMRWGPASHSTESLRWVRPLQGIVAILGEMLVDVEVDGIRAGFATLGHRFHHPGEITIGGANDYVGKLRACHVVVSHQERQAIIAEKAREAAASKGYILVEDAGLVAENAGLTEWPVPLIGDFDPAFLEVPPEVIQLTLRTNQKYFVVQNPPRDGEGGKESRASVRRPQGGGGGPALAPAFICTANIEAKDGGAEIVAGNRKVLAARLSDARFFWEQDRKTPLADHAKKLERITFHEKLGTVADKMERVAKLARWLVDAEIVKAEEDTPQAKTQLFNHVFAAARLAKADLVTEMVGEFPELQGIMGGYYARAEGLPDSVADAIRDHYKPVGQGDEVPTAPVTVAVSLADKLDTLFGFFAIREYPTGSKDPFALRRAAIGICNLLIDNNIRLPLTQIQRIAMYDLVVSVSMFLSISQSYDEEHFAAKVAEIRLVGSLADLDEYLGEFRASLFRGDVATEWLLAVQMFLTDRLKVQQREAGVRHDLIDAVFALGGEDDLVRLLARVKALQSFVATEDGANLLAGYRRAANILKKEGYQPPPVRPELVKGLSRAQSRPSDTDDFASAQSDTSTSLSANGNKGLPYTPEPAEAALLLALDTAEPHAAQAVEAEDFEGAMAALATLRAPIDAFFESVTVNDPDGAKREARLSMLDRVRTAVHRVADFSRIEG